MENSPPLSFESLAKTARNPAAGGYPYTLKGSDLDKNFVFSTLQIDDTLVEKTTGQGGHPARKLKIPAVSGSGKKNLQSFEGALVWKDSIPDAPPVGTHVLGAVDGVLTWIETEEC